MRGNTVSAALSTLLMLACGSLSGDAKYCRDGGKTQIFYTRNNCICRYPEGDPLYLVEKEGIRRCGNNRLIYKFDNGCLVRVSDGRRLYLVKDGKVIRCADGKTLYRIENDRAVRVADGAEVLRRSGEDPLLTFFMVLMLADM